MKKLGSPLETKPSVSFPLKRESSILPLPLAGEAGQPRGWPGEGELAAQVAWIPAYAGMTHAASIRLTCYIVTIFLSGTILGSWNSLWG